MVQRIAGTLSLIAFALCLVMGIMAENSFSHTIALGLKAMCITFFVGLLIGSMSQRMLAENLSDVAKKREIDQSNSPPGDR